MGSSLEAPPPPPGKWPVDPQEDVPISEDRIWVDGCFDFTHHGASICDPIALRILMLHATYMYIVLQDSNQQTNCCVLLGHAGAMLQARRLGEQLYVGVHSDEAILENKGPTVMTLQERFGFPSFQSCVLRCQLTQCL